MGYVFIIVNWNIVVEIKDFVLDVHIHKVDVLITNLEEVVVELIYFYSVLILVISTEEVKKLLANLFYELYLQIVF